MRNTRLFVAASAVMFCLTACNPPAPVGRETAPEEAAPVTDAPIVEAPIVVEASAAEPPVAVAEEPLALRFVSPNKGSAGGGEVVTIDGRGFSQYPRIAFGGVQAWIVSVTPTEIRVMVPSPVEPITGSSIVDVTVQNPPVGSSASSPSASSPSASSPSAPVSATLAQAYSYVDASATPPVAEETPEQPSETLEPSPPVAVASAVKAGDEGGGEGAIGSASAPAASPPSPAAATPTSNLVASFRFEMLTDSEDCPPPNTSVRFSDRSTGGASQWLWDFGDGATSKEQHIEHCYSVPGMRSVTLTVSDARGSASTSKIVTAGME